jgi:hypothetical protein
VLDALAWGSLQVVDAWIGNWRDQVGLPGGERLFEPQTVAWLLVSVGAYVSYGLAFYTHADASLRKRIRPTFPEASVVPELRATRHGPKYQWLLHHRATRSERTTPAGLHQAGQIKRLFLVTVAYAAHVPARRVI